MTTKTHTTYTTWVVTRLFIGSRLSQIRVFNECPKTDVCIVQTHYRWGGKNSSAILTSRLISSSGKTVNFLILFFSERLQNKDSKATLFTQNLLGSYS